MVGHIPLEDVILVRIQVSQHQINIWIKKDYFCGVRMILQIQSF